MTSLSEQKSMPRPLIEGQTALILFGVLNLSVFMVAITWLYFFLFEERVVLDLGLGLAGRVFLDILLLSAMSLPHSFLLDSKWRLKAQRIVPSQIFITLYSLHASISLILLFWLWQPLGGEIFRLEGVARDLGVALNALSWLYMGYALYSTGALKHNGVEQWFNYLKGRTTRHEVPYDKAYRQCRHPIFLAFFLMIWLVPQMSIGRLVIAVYWSAYLVYGTLRKEEKLLRNTRYAQYASQVPPYPLFPKKPFKSIFSRG